MKNSLRVAAAFLLLIFFSFSNVAMAADIPLLTWEKGKSQSVVLGGGSVDKDWKVFLKSSDSKLIELSPSLSNKAGFIVYSISIPREIAEGAYSVITKGAASPETIVAAVQLVEMRRYEITRVPGDLLFFLLSLALWLSALAALRGKRFRQVTFITSTGPKERYLAGEPAQNYIEYVHKLNRLEKLRINVYEQLPDSFFKFLLKSDSRGMHLEFPILWSLLPGFSISISAALGYLTSGSLDLNFVGINLAILLAITAIGSLDIYSGILGAFTFVAVRLWLLTDFSISSATFTLIVALIFFLPALISSYFMVLISSARFNGAQKAANSFIFQWLSPLALLHVSFLIQRSITGSVNSTIGIEALLAASILAGRQIEGYLSKTGIKWRNRVRVVEEFEINLGRLISPSFAISIFLMLVVILYSWTLSFANSISLAVALAAPLALLIVRPTLKNLGFLAKIRRNLLAEIALVVTLSLVAFVGVNHLPLVAGTGALQMILFGMSPVFIHALVSFGADLSDRDINEAEQ